VIWPVSASISVWSAEDLFSWELLITQAVLISKTLYNLLLQIKSIIPESAQLQHFGYTLYIEKYKSVLARIGLIFIQ